MPRRHPQSFLLFLIYPLLSLSLHVAQTSGFAIHSFENDDSTPQRQRSAVFDQACPDGLPGRVTVLQEESLRLGQPAIFSTDCHPSRNSTRKTSFPRLDRRQEQICPADCSNSCSGSGGGPSSGDCSALVSQLAGRGSETFTVDGFGIQSMQYGTCLFQIVNDVSSPFIYCYSAWANRGNGLDPSSPRINLIPSLAVVNSCLPASSGGKCQGSRFSVQVKSNPNAPAATTTAAPAPAPATTSSANSPEATTQGNGSNASTANAGAGGGGSNSSPSSAGGNGGTNAPSISISGSVTITLPAATSLGNLGTASNTGASSTTTLANGSVIVVPVPTLSSGQAVSDPNSGGSGTSGGGGQTGGNGGSAGPNVPAIVGAGLGFLVVLLLLFFWFFFWRRRERIRKMAIANQGVVATKEDGGFDDHDGGDSSVARTLDFSALGYSQGLGSGTDDTLSSPYPLQGANATANSNMRETPAPGTNAFWAMNPKARMLAEESRPRATIATGYSGTEGTLDQSHSRTTGSSHEAEETEISTSFTAASGLSSVNTPVPVYRSRSEREERRRRDHHAHSQEGEGVPHQRRRRRSNAQDRSPSEALSTSVGDESLGERGDSNSVSARTLAQAAAPQLSDGDIDRLAESIVARMQGRPPRTTLPHEDSAGSRRDVVSAVFSEEEPPPPWSAPPYAA